MVVVLAVLYYGIRTVINARRSGSPTVQGIALRAGVPAQVQ
jgi:hypothetical protein